MSGEVDFNCNVHGHGVSFLDRLKKMAAQHKV